MFKTTIAIATALGIAMSTPAHAGQVAVRYSDLDLSSADGRDQLQKRIRAAARKACETDRVTTGSRIPSKESLKCYAEATRKADAAFATILAKQGLGG